MIRKTQSLMYPTDPLAALRALQDLDAPTPAPAREPAPGPKPRPPEPASGDAGATGSEGSSATPLAGAPEPAVRRPRPAEPRRDPPAADPMADAVRRLLAAPYADGAGRGAVTASTVKLPTEVWERLGWVAKLSGRHKQDVITDALKRYFEHVLKG